MRRWGAMARRGALVGAVALVAGCASSPPPPWSEPADYTYDATIEVFGPASGQWRVTVRGGDVTEVEPLDDVARFSDVDGGATTEDFLTFAEYEQMYADAVADGAATARLTRDESGALSRLEVDMSADAQDDEFTVVVTAVEVP